MKPTTARIPIFEVISGGQTGVDRAALDVALELGIRHAGWCPAGRLAEDGPIPPIYQLRETESADYRVRTEKNVIDSDATLILYRECLSGGTELTRRLAVRFNKPQMLIDLVQGCDLLKIATWISDQHIARLNVAGPRESGHPGISRQAGKFLKQLFTLVRPGAVQQHS